MRFLLVVIVAVFMLAEVATGAGKKISEVGNKHNFSYMNISANYRAANDPDIPGFSRGSQVCVFCHTPHHSSGEGPLWNRRATEVAFFKHYSSATLSIDNINASEYGQPNGSSRLCLSCHDGVTALGAIFTTPMSLSSQDIRFVDVKSGYTGVDVTLGYETFSTHHPVSFKYDANVRNILKTTYGKDYWYNPPNQYEVKLDSRQRMQCTTCHDPHQDKSAVPSPTNPFWTSSDYITVCQTCHNIVPAYPW